MMIAATLNANIIDTELQQSPLAYPDRLIVDDGQVVGCWTIEVLIIDEVPSPRGIANRGIAIEMS
jgi:hypothetical protein